MRVSLDVVQRLITILFTVVVIVSCSENNSNDQDTNHVKQCFENGIILKIFKGEIIVPYGYTLQNDSYGSRNHIFELKNESIKKRRGTIISGLLEHNLDSGLTKVLNNLHLQYETQKLGLTIKVYKLGKPSNTSSYEEKFLLNLNQEDKKRYQKEVGDKFYTGVITLSDDKEIILIQDSYQCTWQKMLSSYIASINERAILIN